MANPHLNTYGPIWNLLKQKGYCKIAVPKPLQKRVIKAVIKEKYKDLGHKFMVHSRLKYIVSGSQIEFWLIVYKEPVRFDDL